MVAELDGLILNAPPPGQITDGGVGGWPSSGMKKVDSKAGHYCKLLNLIYSTALYIFVWTISVHFGRVCVSFARLVIKRLINEGECEGLLLFTNETTSTLLYLFERTFFN